MKRAFSPAAAAAFLLSSLFAAPADGEGVTVDCAERIGDFRALHGVNGGPIAAGGLLDLSEPFRRLRISLVRLHDCHWPNPDVVDLHVVFPDPRADPSRPESYDFVRTDPYVQSIVAAGSKVVYRLGESIEHGPDKRRQRPPADADRWAAACLGVVRHYNEGWAGGHRYDVRYWELWNEPDNRPNCWTGTDEEYFRLYAAAARAIKGAFPHLRVGGPAVGNVGRIEADGGGGAMLRPSPFVEKFLAFVRRESLPLDFFSWHLYCDDPAAVAAHASAVRKLLDESGFTRTESHLNEWNYLPGNDWGPVMLAGQGEPRRRFYARLGGAEGAAFAAATLLLLQDCPLDAANFFTGDAGEFGLFERDGVPRKTYHAFDAFRTLLDTPVRVRASADGAARRWVVGAGTNAGRDVVTVLLSNLSGPAEPVELSVKNPPWPGGSAYEAYLLDGGHDLAPILSGTAAPGETIRLEPVKAPAVVLVKLRPAAAPSDRRVP